MFIIQIITALCAVRAPGANRCTLRNTVSCLRPRFVIAYLFSDFVSARRLNTCLCLLIHALRFSVRSFWPRCMICASSCSPRRLVSLVSHFSELSVPCPASLATRRIPLVRSWSLPTAAFSRYDLRTSSSLFVASSFSFVPQ